MIVSSTWQACCALHTAMTSTNQLHNKETHRDTEHAVAGSCTIVTRSGAALPRPLPGTRIPAPQIVHVTWKNNNNASKNAMLPRLPVITIRISRGQQRKKKVRKQTTNSSTAAVAVTSEQPKPAVCAVESEPLGVSSSGNVVGALHTAIIASAHVTTQEQADRNAEAAVARASSGVARIGAALPRPLLAHRIPAPHIVQIT